MLDQPQIRRWLCALLLVVAVLTLAPRRIADGDALSHLATAYRSCIDVLKSGAGDREALITGLSALRQAIERLPPSATLVSCMVAGLQTGGLSRQAAVLRQEARRMFPADPAFR